MKRAKKSVPGMAKPEVVEDSFQNFLTGLGTSRDKRMHGFANLQNLPYLYLAELYRASALAARVVDMPADDMLREGAEVRIPDEEELTEAFGAYLDDLEVEAVLTDAVRKARLFGGAIVLIGANDGEADLSKPLREDAIRSIDYLNVFDAFEAQIDKREENPLKRGYGEPTLFRLYPHVGRLPTALSLVHASRCLVFPGVTAWRRQFKEASGDTIGWGDSVLLRVHETIRDYSSSWAGVSHLLQDFSQTVFKLRGLVEMVAADKGGTLRKRWNIINEAKSVINALILDKDGEEVDFPSRTLAGVSETLREMQARVAVDAGIPVTKLFGTSSGGMGSTGQAEDRTWYDTVKFQQTKYLRPRFNRLVKLAMLAKDSPTGGVEPENWALHFSPLWQESNTEKADNRFKNAQTDKIYYELGVAGAEDIAMSRFGGDEYGMDLTVDLDRVEERELEPAEVESVRTPPTPTEEPVDE